MEKRMRQIISICLVVMLALQINVLQVQAAEIEGLDVKEYVLKKVGQSYPSGYCLKFVEETYQALGGNRPYNCCASKSRKTYMVSSNYSNIPIGATVYFDKCGGGPCKSCGSSYYGHVGIYVGDGYFVHATGGKVQKSLLSGWKNKYSGYGYCGNFKLVDTATAPNNSEIPVPIVCYANSDSRIKTYKTINGIVSGYIDGSSDKVTILNVSGQWCKVRYPIGNRRYKTAYTKIGNFFNKEDFLIETIQLASKKTVYRKKDLKQSFGTVYADDAVMIVGTSGNKPQIIYPVSGGYKMGWISGTYQNNQNQEQESNLISGYYQIMTALNGTSVLDIYGISSENGANLQLCSNNYGLNQAFIVRKESDGYYSITPLHARDKRLDVENNGMTSGTNIIQWQENGGDNQKWKIVKTSDGYYSVISKVNGLYMDVKDGSVADETNVQCHKGNGSLAQKFIFNEATLNGKRYCETEEGKQGTQTKEDNSTTNTNTAASPTVHVSVEELCFNYIYYADRYTDLKAAFGYDKAQLFNHWKQFGIKEGRSASPILDLTYYLKNNADLQKVYGMDYTKAYNHFISCGYKEFRKSSPYYSGGYYRDTYSDLKSYDSYFLLYHYCQFGITEKRQAGEQKYTGNWDFSASVNNTRSE